MRVLDLFSGIGGFSIGLERAGMQTVAFCEIEKYPRSILAKHWPDIPCYEDIRLLTKQRLLDDEIITETSGIDVICGGWPCQPFSHAGARRGQEDDRHLWPEVARLVDELRPRWTIGENVSGFLDLALDDTLADLERIGYEARPIVIPAAAVNAIHRRDRVWIIANLADAEHDGLLAEQELRGDEETSAEWCAEESQTSWEFEGEG